MSLNEFDLEYGQKIFILFSSLKVRIDIDIDRAAGLSRA
jgi:hypothetical protein